MAFSPSSTAIYFFGCGKIFNDNFIANFPGNAAVK